MSLQIVFIDASTKQIESLPWRSAEHRGEHGFAHVLSKVGNFPGRRSFLAHASEREIPRKRQRQEQKRNSNELKSIGLLRSSPTPRKRQ